MRVAFTVLGLIALGALSRLVPHLPNMTALGAVALKSGARFGVWGVAIPIASMLLSDIVIGFYNWQLLVSVYASFALVTLLGRYTEKRSSGRVSAITISGSFIFFLITNTVVWASSTWYAHTLAGLFACYAVALPFLVPMIVGDYIYSFFLNSVPSMHSSFSLRVQHIFRRVYSRVYSTVRLPKFPRAS